MSAEVHRLVARGLQRLADDMVIADDGPHVAIVVGIGLTGEPTMWIATRAEKYAEASHLTTGRDSAEGSSGRSAAPFTLADIETASTYLGDFVTGVRGRGHYQHRGTETPMTPHEYAMFRREQRQQWEIDRHLESDAHLIAHPHPCDACRRRFKTERGMRMHRATCTWSTHPDHAAISTSWAQDGEVTIRCRCDVRIVAPSSNAANRLMRQHLDNPPPSAVEAQS